MLNFVEILSVPAIVSVVYGALTVYKKAVEGKEKLIKIIPVLAAVIGIILGIIAYYAMPEIIAADNIFTAILIGGASGLAATGTNQIFKQLINNSDVKEGNNEKDADGK